MLSDDAEMMLALPWLWTSTERVSAVRWVLYMTSVAGRPRGTLVVAGLLAASEVFDQNTGALSICLSTIVNALVTSA